MQQMNIACEYINQLAGLFRTARPYEQFAVQVQDYAGPEPWIGPNFVEIMRADIHFADESVSLRRLLKRRFICIDQPFNIRGRGPTSIATRRCRSDVDLYVR